MSSKEITQHESTVARGGFDAVLVGFVVSVMAVLVLVGSGIV
jgi:hypothetical protein